MPPRRKVESKKVEEVNVKGKGEPMEVEDDVKTARGRGKKAAAVKPSKKVVEEVEEVPKLKRGQKKEAVVVEEPKARGGRKAKADNGLVASKEKSPVLNRRGRKPAKALKVEEEDESEDELVVPKVSKEPSPVKRGRKPKPKVEDEEEVSDKDEPPPKKGAKKTAKAAKEPEVVPPAKGRPGRKAKVAPVPKESEDEEESEEEKETKKPNSRQQKVDVEKNTTETNYENIDFSACEKNSKGEAANMKIASWNVGGVRAWLKKDGLQYIINESPDILCLQETKCAEKKLPEDFVSTLTVDGTGKYHMYWLDGEKDGYAGVAMFTRTKPLTVAYGIGDDEMDKDSRCITAQFEDYYVLNVYVPNAGRGLVTLPKRLEWNDLLRSYVKTLNNDKPVIICGDMNVAHNEIDLKNPKSNKKNAGFTQEERDGMTAFLGDGLVDVYRHLYPEEKDCYTFWSYLSNARNKNVGWRLDYFLVSERFVENVCDTKIRSTIFGSDHCPLTLHFNCDK